MGRRGILPAGYGRFRRSEIMFGYVTICEPELKVKELRKYKAYYCGLCRTLQEEYGAAGQMTLTYDMTFLIVLLTSLYECGGRTESHPCKVHPLKKRPMLRNEITQYAADMNLLLAYFHLRDDWADERSAQALLGMAALKRNAARAARKYPRQSRIIARELRKLSRLEQEDSRDLDLVSGYFGRVTAELFACRRDRWQNALRRMGFYLGKFIYLMDAYEDLEDDRKAGRYNPLVDLSRRPDFEEHIRTILCMMIADCCREFEQLPCLEDAGILRNILYGGVWNRYQKIQQKKTEQKEDYGNDDKESL